MLETSWITAILQLCGQVTDLLWNLIVKRINMRLFDLLARFHYILSLPRMFLKNSFHLFAFAFQIWNDYIAFGFFLG